MKLTFIALLGSLTFSLSSFAATDMYEIKNAGNKIYHLVTDSQTENYYFFSGVHVIENSQLSRIKLAPISDVKSLVESFSRCLYNKDQKTYAQFKENIEEALAPFGKLTWYSDASYFSNQGNSNVFTWTGHENFEKVTKIFSKADEYGGPGGYYPICSVVVKTFSGVSFLFHAIDTY